MALSRTLVVVAAALVREVGSLTLSSAALRSASAAAATPAVRFAAAPRRHAAVVLEDDEPDPSEVLDELETKMKKSVASVSESLATLRVGRANPSLLDRVEVNYYDTPTPLNQLASVTAPTASQLVVDVYDKSAIGDVEKALFESDIGMTPNNDGTVIRLNVPALTEDRRKELAKTASSLGEEGKVAIRNIRKTAMTKIKKMEKALGKDVVKDCEDDVQKAVKKFEGEVSDLVAKREKEIMTV